MSPAVAPESFNNGCRLLLLLLCCWPLLMLLSS
jgi:hypothetical protein